MKNSPPPPHLTASEIRFLHACLRALARVLRVEESAATADKGGGMSGRISNPAGSRHPDFLGGVLRHVQRLESKRRCSRRCSTSRSGSTAADPAAACPARDSSVPLRAKTHRPTPCGAAKTKALRRSLMQVSRHLRSRVLFSASCSSCGAFPVAPPAAKNRDLIQAEARGASPASDAHRPAAATGSLARVSNHNPSRRKATKPPEARQ